MTKESPMELLKQRAPDILEFCEQLKKATMNPSIRFLEIDGKVIRDEKRLSTDNDL